MKNGYVYLMACDCFHKIGYSKNVEKRREQLDVRPFPIDIIAKQYSMIALDVEREIHRMLAKYRVDNEWYYFDAFPAEKEFCEFVKFVESKMRKGEKHG